MLLHISLQCHHNLQSTQTTCCYKNTIVILKNTRDANMCRGCITNKLQRVVFKFLRFPRTASCSVHSYAWWVCAGGITPECFRCNHHLYRFLSFPIPFSLFPFLIVSVRHWNSFSLLLFNFILCIIHYRIMKISCFSILNYFVFM